MNGKASEPWEVFHDVSTIDYTALHVSWRSVLGLNVKLSTWFAPQTKEICRHQITWYYTKLKLHASMAVIVR